MHPRLSRAAALFVAILVLGLSPSSGRVLAQTPAHAFNPTDVIPFDAAIHTATLPNGLKYFVRRNDQPAKRIALRLAVKAGSLDEADDQQGLAHFIEHMAFNGSTHFKPGEVFSYFESVGARLVAAAFVLLPFARGTMMRMLLFGSRFDRHRVGPGRTC